MEDGEVFIARLDERLKAFEREMNRMERSSEQALRLASDELSRRLENLNHAHAQAVEVQATYLPRDTFERYREISDERVKKLENFNANLTGKTWIGGAVILILAAVIAVLVPRI